MGTAWRFLFAGNFTGNPAREYAGNCEEIVQEMRMLAMLNGFDRGFPVEFLREEALIGIAIERTCRNLSKKP